ncbi:MAG: MMPL family transporter [Actinomycetota bacterium]
MQSRNIAARAGRWSAEHRKTAIWGWIALVIAAVFVGSSLGTRTLDNNKSNVGESGRADKALAGAFPDSASESVLVQSKQAKADDPSFRAAVIGVEKRLDRLGFVRNLQDPYQGDGGQISADRHSALIDFEIPDNAKVDPQQKVDLALAAVAAAQHAHPQLRIDELGDASAQNAVEDSISSDFQKAEVTSLPITLAILVIVFGALVAAGVPLLLALTAVAATIGLIGPISHISPVDQAITSVILLIGLAVGVDYSMFYLRREREERAAGNGERASLEAAAATSGRAVLISGFTVMIAMAGMYIAGDPTFASFATGTILVVAMAMIGSLTVLPALLAWLGDRVEKGRVPFVGRLKSKANGTGFWSAMVEKVMRRPLLFGLAATAALLALAIPAFGLHTANSGVDAFPNDLKVIKTYDRIQAAFPGAQLPAKVVVSAADVTSPQVKAGLAELRQRALQDPHSFGRPITLDISADKSVADVHVPLAGHGTDTRSDAALDKLRTQLVPETVGSAAGVTANVTGDTASSKDFTDVLKQRMPLVFAFVLGAAFLLLLVTFRSIVIPLKAIVLNLLSVGAAYGVVVWIFQEGHLEGLLGFQSTGAITSWLPLFLFVVLFGLSMDYHVFILTRIREAYDGGMSTDQAVAHGIKTTAGVVTSAAAVMVAVFSIFATLSFLDFKEMGVGLAIAVLIDATVVRAILLPATMKLLGDWNWYLPSWLGWLPRVRREAEPEPVRA